jgi:DNA-binding SARP family transcriptional activator/tetratricopeptide (TPR) repeat protein
MLHLKLFGTPGLELGGKPILVHRRKGLALLAYLAVTQRPHSREALAALFWPDVDSNNALGSLRREIFRLKQDVGQDLLFVDRQIVRMRQEHAVDLDVTSFQSLYATYRDHQHRVTPCPDCIPLLKQMVNLNTADFMTGFSLPDSPAFDEWVYFQAESTRKMMIAGLQTQIEWYAQQADYQSGQACARRWLELDRYNEQVYREQMRLTALSGDWAAALRHYEMCKQVLQEELNTTPDLATVRLYESIRLKQFPPEKAGSKAFSGRNLARHTAPPSREEPAEDVFVGRKPQLDRLLRALGPVVGGSGRVMFVTGEAGQGKTWLLREFARQAQEAFPALVVAGGTNDFYIGEGVPYQPFREIMRLLTGNLDQVSTAFLTPVAARRLQQIGPASTAALLAHGQDMVDILLPVEQLEHLAEQSEALRQFINRHKQHGQPYQVDQLRLYEAVDRYLEQLAQEAPLLILLDDLQWAGRSSLNLLIHLARKLNKRSIFLLGAFRPEELAHPQDSALHPFVDLISQMKSKFGDVLIQLDTPVGSTGRPFTDDLLDSEANCLSETFHQKLASYTSDHPLFVVEVLREMKERGDLFKSPDGVWTEGQQVNWQALPTRVEGIIEQRLNRLAPELYELLRVASVQGEVFIGEVIADILRLDPRELARRLNHELDHQHLLIHAQGVLHAGTKRQTLYRFRHHLFQRYLYRSMSPAERMYLHEAVGRALEMLWAGKRDADDLPAVQLARHFQEAQMNEQACQYLLLAGKQAMRSLAFNEAVTHFERGLVLLKNHAHTPELQLQVYELNLALARALWDDGRVVEAVTAYTQTIELAHTLDNSEALARAVLAYEEIRWRLNLNPQLSQKFIREALAAVGEEESALRVILLVNLSRSLLVSGDDLELRETVNKALDIARRINDSLALFEALRIQSQIDRRPESTVTRLSAVQEMISIAKELGHQEKLADGLDLHIYDLLELGQIEQVDQAIAAQHQVAQAIKQPFQLHIAAVFQTMWAILHGDFDEAERLANDAAELSRQIGIAELDSIYGIHMFTIRREQGRIHEIAPLVKLIVASNPESSSWRTGLALIYRFLGQKQECQRVFEQLVSNEFASVPQDALWVGSLAYLAEVCDYLQDAERAGTLYQLLMPYRGRSVVVGGATVCNGAVDRYLGILAKTRADWNAAQQHFEDALVFDEKMQAWPWLAHSCYEYAAMLRKKAPGTGNGQANNLLTQAKTAAERMGMVWLLEKIEQI